MSLVITNSHIIGSEAHIEKPLSGSSVISLRWYREGHRHVA